MQVLATFFALGKTADAKSKLAWGAFASATLLMAGRTSVALYHHLTSQSGSPLDPASEIVTFVISSLLLAGILWHTSGGFFPRNMQPKARVADAATALRECNERLLQIQDDRRLLREICEIIVERGGYQRAWITLTDPDDKRKFQLIAQHGTGGEHQEFTAASEPVPRLMSRTSDTSTPPALTPLRRTGMSVRHVDAHPSSIALPLSSAGNIFGELNIHPLHQDEVSSSEIQLLSELATTLSYRLAPSQSEREHRASSGRLDSLFRSSPDAILLTEASRQDSKESRVAFTIQDIASRREYEDRSQRQIRQLKALREIDSATTAVLDPRMTFQVLLDQITGQLGADAADILIFDQDSQMLIFESGEGFKTDALRHTRLSLGEGYAGRAALEQTIVSVPDLSGRGLSSSKNFSVEGFVSYVGVPLIARARVQGVLEIFHRDIFEPDEEQLAFLETLGGQAAIAIDNALLFNELSHTNAELLSAYDTTLEGWSRALELRDIETEGHSRRVTKLSLRLAREVGLEGTALLHLRRGALLHDVGKMGIPDSILHKPGSLNNREWEIMRRHPQYAYDMLSSIDYLRPALDIPYSHHERWDGYGYPNNLKGEEIPLPARIFAVVDVWDALRSDRPYRKAWTDDEALEYMSREQGKHFDPRVLDHFFQIIPQHVQQ